MCKESSTDATTARGLHVILATDRSLARLRKRVKSSPSLGRDVVRTCATLVVTTLVLLKKNDKNQLPMESKLETAHTLKVPVHSCTCTMLSGAAQFALVKPHEPIKEHTHGDDENLESRGFQKNVATIERRAFTPSLCFSFLAFLLFARLGKGPLPWLRTS